jgi:type IV pilus assembly protein PilO
MKKENSEEEKSKQIKAMMDRTDVTINSYLNKDQKDSELIMEAVAKTYRYLDSSEVAAKKAVEIKK